MRVTLTIEVPNDFKKGECNRCPLDIPAVMTVDCYADNCPLEIQENLPLVIIKDNKCVDTASGHLYSVDYNICKYCSKSCKNVGYIVCGEFEPIGE